jgi:hypothetical protein
MNCREMGEMLKDSSAALRSDQESAVILRKEKPGHCCESASTAPRPPGAARSQVRRGAVEPSDESKTKLVICVNQASPGCHDLWRRAERSIR